MGFDKIIKSSKKKAPALPENFSANIMKEIEQKNLVITRELKVTWFKQLAISTISIFFMLSTVVFLNSAIFEVKMNGILELLKFNNEFILDFIYRLPFDLILLIIFSATVAILLIHKVPLFKTFAIKYLIIIVVLTTGLSGTVLANSGINEKIQGYEMSNDSNIPFMHHFYTERATFNLMHDHVVLGEIIEINGNNITIETPSNDQFVIKSSEDLGLQKGQYIRVNGDKVSDNNFEAKEIQHCNFESIENYYIHHQEMHDSHMNNGTMKNGMMM